MYAALGYSVRVSRGPVGNLSCSKLNAEVTLCSALAADATGGINHLPVTDQPSRLLGAMLWSDDVPNHRAQRRIELRSLNDYPLAFTYNELALDVRVSDDQAAVPELEPVTVAADQRAEGNASGGVDFPREVSMQGRLNRERLLVLHVPDCTGSKG